MFLRFAALLLLVAPASSEDRSTLHGQVVDANGAPQSAAIVTLLTNDAPPVRVVADDTGHYRVSGELGYTSTLVAASADGRSMTALRLRRAELRALSLRPLPLQLEPALEIEAHVRLGDEPAADVLVSGFPSVPFPITSARTDSDGVALLRYPPSQPLQQVWAWDEVRGIAMWHAETSSALTQAAEELKAPLSLVLMPTAARTLLVVDPEGRPVEGVPVLPFFRFAANMDHFMPATVADTWGRTDEAGEAVFPWMPAEPAIRMFPSPIGDEWKHESGTEGSIEKPTVMVVRRNVRVRGRLLAQRADPDLAGVLIEGRGEGPGRYSSLVSARADSAGYFELVAAPGYVYSLDVRDAELACAGFVGELVDGFEVPLLPAAPLTISVTMGADRAPVADASISLHSPREVEWLENGRLESMETGARSSLSTDATGQARFGLGPGLHELKLYVPNWSEERTITVSGTEPIALDFHRERAGARTIHGTLSRAEGTGELEGAKVSAYGLDEGNQSRTEVVADAEGRFELSIDADEVALVVRSAGERFAAGALAGALDSTVALELLPVASYAGEVVDERGAPLANHQVVLELRGLRSNRAPADRVQRTDEAGAFEVSGILANSAYDVIVKDQVGNWLRHVEEVLLDPRERRSGMRWMIAAVDETEEEPPAEDTGPIDFARDLRSHTLDVESVAMHTLLVVRAHAPETEPFSAWVLDYDQTPEVASYLPLSYTTTAFVDDPRALAALRSSGLTLPPGGHVLLAAFDGGGELLDETAIAIADESRRSEATAFLRKNAPALPDARALLDDALALAQREQKRVFVQLGGARCGPCFALGRWYHDHAPLLDKDYVPVKLHSARFVNGVEVARELRPRDGGIPWYAILDSSGKTLITSDGPLGNIGFPSGIGAVRYFREMLEATRIRLTEAEIDQLLEAFEQD